LVPLNGFLLNFLQIFLQIFARIFSDLNFVIIFRVLNTPHGSYSDTIKRSTCSTQKCETQKRLAHRIQNEIGTCVPNYYESPFLLSPWLPSL
jgi:hypothetical protein